VKVTINEIEINVALWDTAGQEEYSRLRALSYPNTDVFIVIFSLLDKESLINAENKWLQEITTHCPDTPFIVVGVLHKRGTKISDNVTLADRVVSVEDVMSSKLATHKNYGGYVEASSIKMIGVQDALILAVNNAMWPDSKRDNFFLRDEHFSST